MIINFIAGIYFVEKFSETTWDYDLSVCGIENNGGDVNNGEEQDLLSSED